MVSLRVFVSAAVANSPQQEADLAQLLISDLRHAGAGVVIDDEIIPDKQFLSFLEQELPQCHWLLLLQTAEALCSLRSQATIHTALQLLKQKRIEGIVQIVCPSSETEGKPLSWPDTQVVAFHGDYPRVRDKVLLELNLLQIDDVIAKDVSKIFTGSLASSEEIPTNQQTDTYKDVPTQLRVARGKPIMIMESVKKLFHHTALWNGFLPSAASVKKPVPSSVTSPVVHGDRPTSLPEATHPKQRVSLLLLLCLLLLFLLLFSASFLFFTHPQTHQSTLVKMQLTPTSPPATSIGLHATPTIGSTPPTNLHPTIAQDTFQRADQALWGTASDGQLWGGDANTTTAKGIFSISGNTGQIANKAGTYEAILGLSATNVDVIMSGMINQFAGDMGTVNLGVALRWQDPNHWYKALIDGKNLIILSSAPGATGNFTVLGEVPFPAQGNTAYTLRFRAIGTTLSAKVWPDGQNESVNWMITANDGAFINGRAGIRVVIQNTTQVNITAFQETKY